MSVLANPKSNYTVNRLWIVSLGKTLFFEFKSMSTYSLALIAFISHVKLHYNMYLCDLFLLAIPIILSLGLKITTKLCAQKVIWLIGLKYHPVYLAYLPVFVREEDLCAQIKLL